MTLDLSKVWLDGAHLASTEAGVHVLSHSLHYGVGAFEGIRSYAGKRGTHLFRLQDHVRRLVASARLLRLTIPDGELIATACAEVVREARFTDAYVRPLVFVGEGAMGLFAPDNPVHVMVTAWSWSSGTIGHGDAGGVRACISSWKRPSFGAGMPRGKITGHYVTGVMAKRDAMAAGFDEALMTDDQGYVCEGTGQNLFVVRNGAIVTPPLSSNILAGITRETLLTIAREDGLVTRESPVTRDDLYLADEAFLTGTASEVSPIVEIDRRPVGDGRVGPITERLRARYMALVRAEDDSHPEWSTPV